MKKIISFSLWGNNKKYTIGMIKNVELALSIYKDWIVRIYCGKSTPNDIIETLKKYTNTEIVLMNEIGNLNGMFWRFKPAFEDDVDIMISRDADSRLSFREKSAVDEWINSNKDFHIMRDHPWHAIAILGGMWGVKNKLLLKLKNEFEKYPKGNFWQVDQNFLKEKIYPFVKDKSFVHDEFFNYESWSKPFPKKRENQEFVGESFDYNDVPNLEHRKIIKLYLAKK